MAEIITLEVINWEKFNPRKDIKKPHWFACSNSLFDNHEFFDFTHTEMLAWLYILSLASKKQTPIVTIHWAHVEKVGRIKRKDFLGAIEKLERNQCLRKSVQDTYAIRTQSVRDPNATLQDRTLQDTTEQDITKQDTLCRFGPLDLLDSWNTKCENLPKAKELTAKRTISASARLKEHPEGVYWSKVIERIVSSDFCNGKAPNSKGWVATFDWLIAPDSNVKIMEGKYDNRANGSKRMSTAEYAASLERKAGA